MKESGQADTIKLHLYARLKIGRPALCFYIRHWQPYIHIPEPDPVTSKSHEGNSNHCAKTLSPSNYYIKLDLIFIIKDLNLGHSCIPRKVKNGLFEHHYNHKNQQQQ